ncbi:pentapeptide repeat-containing protein [Amycolatopsis sp. H6(2020)]|nr:pentapeptide repeat-containing protein [Amycolatopsis sp. H6(2020)]
MAALGALVFTGLSLKVTQSQNAAQNDLAAQSQYTDRYTKAVDQLGQQGLEKQQIRLGGIYALERLTRDSPRDQPTIIEVLSSFVRTAHSPATGEGVCPRPSVDVQAALSVLGRRDTGHDNRTSVDLRGACLDHVDLTGAKLAGADLSGAHLMGANLNFAYLNGANLDNADLTGASLELAHLPGVSLRANLTRANLRGAHAAKAILAGANLTDGLLAGADLTDAVLSGADLTRVNLSHARLIRAKLSFATPASPGLTDADLRFADLTGADLADANLSGANLTDAVHNWETRVDGTVTNSGTRGKWW